MEFTIIPILKIAIYYILSITFLRFCTSRLRGQNLGFGLLHGTLA